MGGRSFLAAGNSSGGGGSEEFALHPMWHSKAHLESLCTLHNLPPLGGTGVRDPLCRVTRLWDPSSPHQLGELFSQASYFEVRL